MAKVKEWFIKTFRIISPSTLKPISIWDIFKLFKK